ncbi:two-component system sensor histidine kinase CreC [Atopomonas sediminilitoris]|uniref:two-component system sensor histidine kinase CreC n=1 Tax=Atopomonas sediminilitoris TaxID=2919919 RepID=UPI001F4DE586|nr:two-component system sensor histidine kinase CreC [Atopomonas sediminilitoris]MCJ8169273.1 two-component system sensor histidine kinase CreC [Atopomonas sediminilitoris]
MRLGIRIFAVYFLFVGLAGYFLLNTVNEEIRPGVRQSSEETLVDTANLLAELLRDDLKAGRLQQSRFVDLLKAYGARQPQATIWGIEKQRVNHRVYVTDAKGLVLLDSNGAAVGQDYSRWNDVYLTLKGEYGARSSREVADDPDSSVMYVAAPIKDGDTIIGVVSVAKPNRTLQPYIVRTQQRLTVLAVGLIVLGLLIGAALSWWLARSLRRLGRYADAVSAGERIQAPQFKGGELAHLTKALVRMRAELDGKQYVERYVHTLTHELKSPLAAIKASGELLQEPLPYEDQQRFADNVVAQSGRMQQLIERLLNLALLEQQQALVEPEIVSLHTLCHAVVEAQQARIDAASITLRLSIDAGLVVRAERLLLEQALHNLLDNALDFTPDGGQIIWQATQLGRNVVLELLNQGPSVPDYALPRLHERFYSLPRPSTGAKSTGLGLNFVTEVAHLHGGRLQIKNCTQPFSGVVAGLVLPLPALT